MAAKPEKPVFGVQFPMDKAEGRRGTTVPAKAILAASIRATKSKSADEVATKLVDEKNSSWRFGYLKHFEKMIRFSCESNDKAVAAAKAGLNEARKQFVYIDKSGKETTFSEYTKRTDFTSFHTNTVVGDKANDPAPHFFVYENKDAAPADYEKKLKKIQQNELKALVNEWAEKGTVEPDVARSIHDLIGDGTKGLDLKGKCFVLFGAGSAMGPFNMLMDHGATVVAIDVKPDAFPNAGQAVWGRLTAKAKSSRGTLIYPTEKEFAALDDAIKEVGIGCNITVDTGRIAAWLKEVLPGQDLVLGNYTYLDGEDFVKLSVAIDWIMEETIKNRPPNSVSLSLLCTPTDLHIVPPDSVDAAKKNFRFNFSPKRLMLSILSLLSLGKFLKLNYMKPAETDDNKKIYLCCSAATEQGPNYLFAKRLQTWRYMLSYNDANVKAVSINIAPSTATPSVYKNKFIKWSMEGWSFFQPLLRFFSATSQTLMGGLMIADVINQNSAAWPKNRGKFQIDNVVSLVSHNSAHGGMWRVGYNIDSLGPVSAVIYLLGGGPFTKKKSGYIFMFGFYSIVALIGWLIFTFISKRSA